MKRCKREESGDMSRPRASAWHIFGAQKREGGSDRVCVCSVSVSPVTTLTTHTRTMQQRRGLFAAETEKHRMCSNICRVLAGPRPVREQAHDGWGFRSAPVMQPWASSRTPTPESWCVLCVSCSHRCASQVACIVPVVYVSFMHAWTSARRRVSMMSDTCVCASSWILVAEVSSATSQTERDSVSLLLAVSLPSPCPSAPPNPPHPCLHTPERAVDGHDVSRIR